MPPNSHAPDLRSLHRVQKWLRLLPPPLRRIKTARALSRLAGSTLQVVQFPRGQVVVDLRDVWAANYLVKGGFADYGYFSLVDALLTPGALHLDVGANFGFHTFGLVRQWSPQGVQFIMIEANPECCQALNLSIQLNHPHPVELIEAAVGAQSGQAALSFDRNESGRAHLSSGATSSSTISIPVKKLDDLLPNASRDIFMKMDIEGSELNAFKGAIQLLQSGCVKHIYFEVNVPALRLQQSSFLDIHAFLTTAGYKLFWPNADLAWIKQTLGHNHTPASLVQHLGPNRWPVLPFHLPAFDPNTFGQCDLLAVRD